jgi:gamma-glutamyltranspeptidase
MQMVSAVFDHGLNVGEAVGAPRWAHHQGRMNSTFPHSERNALEVEDRVGGEVAAALKRLGHPVEVLEAWGATGSAGAIQVDGESGTLMAAADPRRDGQALVG